MTNAKLLEEFLTEAAMAAGLRVTRRTLRQWRQERKGPPFARIGRLVLYPKTAFTAWLEANLQKPRRAA